ncbi:hypothetical protein [Arthrobacter sp. ok909]|uniref:hypothetical protein n=1 Tax=Arthrobacter sp. ok909 TaxID=1761746 RepID=UPI001114625B|nr:hypothetical protein [Arthrobacter sp. ok909]
MLMVIVFGLGLGLSFLTGDARFLLLKDSAITGGLGVSFLVLAAPGTSPDFGRSQDLESGARRGNGPGIPPQPGRAPLAPEGFRRLGSGLIAEASTRAVLVHLLPIHVMVGVSAALAVTVFAALIAWTAWDLKRRQAAWSS